MRWVSDGGTQDWDQTIWMDGWNWEGTGKEFLLIFYIFSRFPFPLLFIIFIFIISSVMLCDAIRCVRALDVFCVCR